MAQVELDLLVGPLDEERRVGVHDGPQALEGEAGGDADHQLLADPDVEHALVARQLAGADLGQHDGDAGILLQRSRRRGRRSVRACSSSLHLRHDDVRPRAGRRERSLERLVVAAVDARRAPALQLEPRGDPARPVVASRTGCRRRPSSAARARAGRRAGRPPSCSPRRARRRRRGRPCAPRSAARRARAPGRPRSAARARASRWRSPRRGRACGRGGCPAASRRRRSRRGSRRRGSPSRRARRSTPSGRGPWRAGSGRARDRSGSAGSNAQDAVVEHPEHVERRERAPVVLLVAGQEREQPRQVVVSGCGRCRAWTHRKTSTMV